MVKLTFSQQEHLQISPTSLAKKNMRASLRFRVRETERQRDREIKREKERERERERYGPGPRLFDGHEYIHT